MNGMMVNWAGKRSENNKEDESFYMHIICLQKGVEALPFHRRFEQEKRRMDG